MASHRELLRSLRDRGGRASFDPILALPWRGFNQVLMKLDERQATRLLSREQEKKKRLRVMLRIQERLSKLRRERERLSLARLAKR